MLWLPWGGRFGVVRKLGVRTELFAFRNPNRIGGHRGHSADTPDLRVRRRSACEGFLARNAWKTD